MQGALPDAWIRVSFGWTAAVAYVGLTARAMEELERAHPKVIRITFTEFSAWAEGVGAAETEDERRARTVEGLRYFAQRLGIEPPLAARG